MILLNAFVGFFAIFISPQIFLYYKYKNLNYSLVLVYGLILSYTGAWLSTLTNFYLDLPSIFTYLLAYFIAISSLIYMYLNKEKNINNNHGFLIWLFVLIVMLPLLYNMGIGFSIWDVLASWNKWAMELFENKYYPIDAAYPILMPGIWSLIYKIQGTNEIWWTAQITHLVLPLLTLTLVLSLYNETKNKTYLFMAIFIYPYLVSTHTINGNMDMPVMIMGTLSLIVLYTAETYKGKIEFEYYVYASLLLAGISSITKQAGFAFIVFDLIYIVLNIKFFENKKRLIIMIVLTFFYFLSYLSMYYQNNISSATGNFKHLGDISQQKLSKDNFSQNLQHLNHNFFALPANIPLLTPLLSLIKFKFITLFLIILGFILFIFKDLRKYNSVSFLSGLFFILGTIVWIKFFSYDERNALWVKSFFIVFLSINLNYVITRYIDKPIFAKVIFSVIILSISIYLLSLGDKFTYEKQKSSQMKAGVRYGCLPSITYAAKLLEGKDTCVKIYTNELPMTQNYLLKTYKDKFILMGRDYKFQSFKYLEHKCEAGRYIIFRRASVVKSNDWWKVTKLTRDGIIHNIPDEKVLVYFVPPNIKLDDDYFKRTDIVNIKLQKYKKNVKYALGKYVEKDNIYTISAWAFINNVQIDKTRKFILLKNDQHEYIIRTKMQPRSDVTKHFKAQDLDSSGFITHIDKKDFPKGTYDVHILLIDNNNTQYQVPINKKINIKGDYNEE